MATEYVLNYTAAEIDEKLEKIDKHDTSIKQLIEDVTILQDDKKTEVTVEINASELDWEIGVVNTTGANLENNYGMRIATAIYLPKGAKISNAVGNKFNVAEYESWSSVDNYMLRTYRTMSTEDYITTADGYVRISHESDGIRFADDETLMDEVALTFSISYTEKVKNNFIPRVILPFSGYVLESTTDEEAQAPTSGNLANLYTKWDALTSQYPNNISMEVLGMDASGLYEIRCYTITSNSDNFKWTLANPQKNLKILWISGIHGHESTVFVDDLKFFSELLKQDNEVTARLMDNCTFKVIPAMSPWGYENGSRTNFNGVNLNRNFSKKWVLAGEGTNNYSGPSPMSEAESQVIAQFLENNKDCYIAINRHSSSGFAPTSVLGYLCSEIEIDQEIAYNVVKFMSNQIKRSNLFDYITNTTTVFNEKFSWEVGSVSSGGLNLENNWQLRTTEAIWLPKGTVISNSAGYEFNVCEYEIFNSAADNTLRVYRGPSSDDYIVTENGYVRVSFTEGNTRYPDIEESVLQEHINTMSFIYEAHTDVYDRCLHTVESTTATGTLDQYYNAMGIHGYLYEASPINLYGNTYYAEDWGRKVWQRFNTTHIGNLLYALILQNEYI